MKIDPETEFMTEMMKLGYGLDVKGKLLEISKKIDWLEGWPENKVSFWNSEAFMWSYKIKKEIREMISKELNFSAGNNLDLGCGAFSYLPSVCFDMSPKMLQFNDNCLKKVIGDLEKRLPFDSGSFDSVTTIFVLNYVENYSGLLREIKRILKDEGDFVMVLSSKGVNEWQRQKEVNNFGVEEWVRVIESVGFSVKSYEKEGFWFFKCSN